MGASTRILARTGIRARFSTSHISHTTPASHCSRAPILSSAEAITPPNTSAPRLPQQSHPRHLHTSPKSLKDSPSAQSEKQNLLERDSVSPTSTEYSQTSGGGDSAASHSEVAFDPQTTAPEEQREKERRKNKAEEDPLAVSPGDEATRDWGVAEKGKEKNRGKEEGDGESRSVKERKDVSANQRK